MAEEKDGKNCKRKRERCRGPAGSVDTLGGRGAQPLILAEGALTRPLGRRNSTLYPLPPARWPAVTTRDTHVGMSEVGAVQLGRVFVKLEGKEAESKASPACLRPPLGPAPAPPLGQAVARMAVLPPAAGSLWPAAPWAS